MIKFRVEAHYWSLDHSINYGYSINFYSFSVSKAITQGEILITEAMQKLYRGEIENCKEYQGLKPYLINIYCPKADKVIKEWC